MKKYQVTVIGLSGWSIFLKVNKFHELGQTIVADEIYEEPGGKGYNQAWAINKLGGACLFVTIIGNDQRGKKCQDIFNQQSSQSIFITKDEPTALATIITDNFGENQVTVYPGVSNSLQIEDLKKYEDEIFNTDFLLIQNELNFNITNYLLNTAYKKHIKVIFNPAPPLIYNKEWIDKVWLLTPNEFEFQKMFAISNQSNILEYKRILKEKMVKQIIITLGSKGAAIWENNEFYILSNPTTNCVDTTGAGDCFNAALTYGVANNMCLKEAFRFAIIASSISVQKKGTINSYPKIDQIIKYLK